MEDTDDTKEKFKQSIQQNSNLLITASFIFNIFIICIYQLIKFMYSDLPFHLDFILLVVIILFMHFLLFSASSKISIKFLSVLPWSIFFFVALLFRSKNSILDPIKTPFANTFGYPIATAWYGLSNKFKMDWLCNPDLVIPTVPKEDSQNQSSQASIGGSYIKNTMDESNQNMCAKTKDVSVVNLLRKVLAKPEIFLSTIGTSTTSKDLFLKAFQKSGMLNSKYDGAGFSVIENTINSWFNLRDNIAQLVWLLLIGLLSGLVAIDVISSNESIKSLAQYINNDEQRAQLYKDYNTLDNSDKTIGSNVESVNTPKPEPEPASEQIFS